MLVRTGLRTNARTAAPKIGERPQRAVRVHVNRQDSGRFEVPDYLGPVEGWDHDMNQSTQLRPGEPEAAAP